MFIINQKTEKRIDLYNFAVTLSQKTDNRTIFHSLENLCMEFFNMKVFN